MAPFIILSLFAALAIGMPVGIALATIGMGGIALSVGPGAMMGIIETIPLSVTHSYELITIPMFILMAELIVVSGVAERLFEAVSIWVGRIRGGLAVATALAGAGFGAISGSSTAAAAALSSTSIPAMMRAGYDPKFSCGVVAVSGTLAMLIPPSLALVLYGIIAEVSIARLLIAGIIPGIIVTLAIILTVQFLLWRDPSLAPASNPRRMADKIRAMAEIWPMLLLLFMVTGVIYLGIATPTEASGLGAAGALLITVMKGKLNWSTFSDAMSRTLRASCMILLIVVGAKIFGVVLTLTQITQTFVATVSGWDTSPYVVLSMIILVYLIMGCFMDQVATLILTVPITVPVILALGFDPVWFGVIVVVTAEIGMITPPLGLNAFIVSRYAKRPLGEVFSGLWPHIIAHLIVIAVLVIFPQLVMWLPNTTAN
ncbi:tripartite ATP-independent transporter DctM subunit [Rhodoligotrophos appendicifer]|uniref:TRAP transporter large permease n=1 Tax=Rhodoligotrophos appendicifer TaxID=987056 RepID=UPI0011805565|nr:TRAP transporter large permease subunit [Rhodoligotrophos appendicifer]